MTSGVASVATAQNIDGQVWRSEKQRRQALYQDTLITQHTEGSVAVLLCLQTIVFGQPCHLCTVLKQSVMTAKF